MGGIELVKFAQVLEKVVPYLKQISGAALMLNPRYRTFEGFLSLIQKDWLSMGHKCADRLNLSLSNDPKG